MMARNRIAGALVVAIVATVGLALPAVAQQPAVPTQQPAAGQTRPLKIAVINGDRVILESNVGVSVQQRTQTAAEGWDARVRAKQQELDATVAQAQQQRLTLTQDALTRLQGQIEQLRVDLQRLRDDAQRAITRLADEAQVEINNVLIPAVEQLANAEGYDLILDTRIQGILYFADAIDATDRYIAMVNAQYPLPEPQRPER